MAYVDEVEPGGIISTVPSPTGNTRLERRGTRWMFVKGRLKPGATYDAAAANLTPHRQAAADRPTSRRTSASTSAPCRPTTCTSIRSRIARSRPIGARPDARRRPRAADRLRQRREHAAGARVGPAEGDRHPPRDRREPAPARAAAALRERRDGGARRRRRRRARVGADAARDVDQPADSDSAVVRAADRRARAALHRRRHDDRRRSSPAWRRR